MSVVVKDLRFSYGVNEVLKGIDVTASAGELLSILGPNGVGKSTLFRCMLGLLKGYSGIIEVGGLDINKLTAAQMAKLVAYIPQSHYPSFNYSVLNMVLMGTTSQISALRSPGRAQLEMAEAALEQVGVAHLSEKIYTHISGGERQLVLIARALAQNARILVLDEPTANLDYGNQLHVMSQVKALTRSGYTVIQSTHQPEQAFQYSDHVLAIKDGTVLADGRPSDIVTEELMKSLYAADIEVVSLYEDKVRLCIPRNLL